MRRKGFILPLLLILFALVVVLIGVFVYFKVRPTDLISNSIPIKESVKKEWVGVIETKKGLVKLSQQGILEKDSSGNVKTNVPPWSNVLDENIAVPRVLLQDGQIVFVGSPKISSAPKENIIYSWNINSPETPKPLLEIPGGQKIQSFAISPDNKQAAIISVTRTSDELHEGLGSLEAENTKKQLEERDKQFQEELRTVLIYDVKTGKVIKELKKKLLDLPSRRTSGGKLLWNKNGLFILDKPEIILFDSKNWGIIDTIPDIKIGPASSLVDLILISPDGKEYFSQYTVNKIPSNERISQFDFSYLSSVKLVNLKDLKEPIDGKEDLENKLFWDGPQVFSPDSEKVLIQGRNNSQTNFTILELDLKSGKTQKIGDSEILKFGSMSTSQIKSLFLFLTYSPSGDKIFFTANYPTANKTAATDLFQLKKGEQKAELIDSFDGLNVNFFGWYLSNSN